MVLLLLVYCFMYIVPPIVCGACVSSLFGMHYFMSFLVFAIMLTRKRELIVFAFIVFWISRYCKCPLALSRGAVDESAVCDCGIS